MEEEEPVQEGLIGFEWNRIPGVTGSKALQQIMASLEVAVKEIMLRQKVVL